MPAPACTHKHRLVGVCGDIVNLREYSQLSGLATMAAYALMWERLTRNELSRVSVYQQSFVEWKGLSANSGKKMDTKCRIASVAGSGSDLD